MTEVFNIKKASTRKTIRLVLAILLLIDLGYSYKQYLGQPLDGDMAWNLIPIEDVKPTLSSPLGFTAISYVRTYALEHNVRVQTIL